MKILQKIRNHSKKIILVFSVLIVSFFTLSFFSLAVAAPSATPPLGIVADQSQYYCGSGKQKVYTSIDFGCSHKIGNPITDMTFAIIRLLSDGVGIVVIGSIIVGGIQYSASHGDPQAAAAASNRIRSSLVALFIFIFAYAILNYVIPAGFFENMIPYLISFFAATPQSGVIGKGCAFPDSTFLGYRPGITYLHGVWDASSGVAPKS